MSVIEKVGDDSLKQQGELDKGTMKTGQGMDKVRSSCDERTASWTSVEKGLDAGGTPFTSR